MDVGQPVYAGQDGDDVFGGADGEDVFGGDEGEDVFRSSDANRLSTGPNQAKNFESYDSNLNASSQVWTRSLLMISELRFLRTKTKERSLT